MRLGTPYKGSKSGIANRIMELLPPAGTFVDLFAGGCAMTHAAMLSGKYDRFVVNDICDEGVRLFCAAIRGDYANENRWISREDFNTLKSVDPFVSICWSFGNNQRTYMYSREIEPYKRAYHFAFFFGDNEPAHALGMGDVFDGVCDVPKSVRYREMRKRLRAFWTERRMMSTDSHGRGMVQLSSYSLESLKSLERLQSLDSLKRLQSLESLQSLERLQHLNTSYECVDIPEDALIYCDPPYANTDGYDKKSDRKTTFNPFFWDWVREHKHNTIVSEYSAPDDFVAIAKINKRCTLCSQNNKAAVECVFIHRDSRLMDYGFNAILKEVRV